MVQLVIRGELNWNPNVLNRHLVTARDEAGFGEFILKYFNVAVQQACLNSKAFVLLVNALYLVSCQNDGRYRPPTTTTRRPIYRTYRPFDSLNRNRNTNDGRYVGGNDGRYRARNDGRYAGGNDGRYVHVDNKYQHTGDGDRGQYSHVGGPSGSDAGYRGGSGGGAGSNLGVGTGSNVGGGAGSNDGASGSPPEPAAPAAVPPPPAPAPIRIPTTVAPAPVRRPTVQVASGPSGDGWKIIHLDHRTRPDGYNYMWDIQNICLIQTLDVMDIFLQI